MALLLVGPGYVCARLSGLAGFRERGAAEQFLWSIAASFPIAIALFAFGGRVLPAKALDGLFLLLDLAALILLFQDVRRSERVTGASRRSTRWMLALMALFGVYCVLALTDVQVGHRLYVSTVIADWSVRVPMVEAAMRSAAAGVAVPPINGLSTLTAAGFGHAPHLRYYYFWYIVVAQVARPLHMSAHAALIASCAWAGWGLIAAAFLAMKYMLGPLLQAGARLRRGCFLLLLIGGVLGLDILPTALLWISPKLHPYPEMEWWHQDRTPSFLGAVLYAPHHMAAFCCLLTGFLALLLTTGAVGGTGLRFRNVAGAAVLAGIAFAAGAGTSLFPTFCFVFVLSIWAIDLLRRREFRSVVALAVAGAVAVLLAHPYLQELSAGSSAATGFAGLTWRNDPFLAMQEARHHLFASHRLVATLARQPGVLVMDFFDLGFYTLVLVAGVRFLRRPARRTAGECALAAIILGAAIPAFFLTSTATSGPNDLGVDAGFLLRFGLQIAAVPWVWKRWRERTPERAPARSAGLLYASAVTLFALGLSAQVYQVVSERLYYPVVGPGFAHKQIDAFTHDRMDERMYNIREAYREVNRQLAASAPDTHAVQFNPVGVMQPAETLYAGRQVASWDTGCGTSYGGEYKRCAPYFANLLFLFGNTLAGVDAGRAENDRQDNLAPTATLADFEATCRTLHISAIMAESTDSIWQRPQSWVWTAPVIVANETVRVLRCPVSP